MICSISSFYRELSWSLVLSGLCLWHVHWFLLFVVLSLAFFVLVSIWLGYTRPGHGTES